MPLKPNLDLLVQRRDLSYRKMQDLTGINYRYFGGLISGRTVPTLEELESLCRLFNCNVELLYPNEYDRKVIMR